MTISTIDPSVSGKYVFRFVATEPRFKFVDTTVSFAVTISCEIGNLAPEITAAIISNTIYVLRSAKATFKIPEYTYEPKACPASLSISVENLSQDASRADIFPSFF